MNVIKLYYIILFYVISVQSFSQCSSFQIVTDKTSICAPEIIQFNITNPIAGSTYEWNVGNGVVNGSDTLFSFYSLPQTINASVKITLPSGGVCNVVKKSIAEINPEPIPLFEISKILLCEGPDTITLRDITPNSASRCWVVDGTNYNNTSKTIIHKYVTDGSKRLSLIVTDRNGCKGVKEFIDTIVVFPKPAFSFIADATSGCLPQTVNYTLLSDPVIPNFTKTYFWGFDGVSNSKDTSTSPGARAYNSSGEFDVTLDLEVINGCTYKVEKEGYINIGDTVILNLNPATVSKCEGEIVHLVQSNNPLPGKIDWTFSGVAVDVLSTTNSDAKY
ncbi:hypothetical protein OAD66_09455 [Bacteroidia bacterium]|nr:hypothetical protein [Bacteroidia bacterium]